MERFDITTNQLKSFIPRPKNIARLEFLIHSRKKNLQVSKSFQIFKAVPFHTTYLVVMKIQLFQRLEAWKRCFCDCRKLVERKISENKLEKYIEGRMDISSRRSFNSFSISRATMISFKVEEHLFILFSHLIFIFSDLFQNHPAFSSNVIFLLVLNSLEISNSDRGMTHSTQATKNRCSSLTQRGCVNDKLGGFFLKNGSTLRIFLTHILTSFSFAISQGNFFWSE